MQQFQRCDLTGLDMVQGVKNDPTKVNEVLDRMDLLDIEVLLFAERRDQNLHDAHLGHTRKVLFGHQAEYFDLLVRTLQLGVYFAFFRIVNF